jgi:hypothetical protein
MKIGKDVLRALSARLPHAFCFSRAPGRFTYRFSCACHFEASKFWRRIAGLQIVVWTIRLQRTVFEEQKAMLNPSKSDCIAILSAASRVSDADPLLPLDYTNLGLSRNAMQTAAAFLTERGCFTRYTYDVGGISVGCLSLQGRLRLDQLANG